MLIAGFLQYQLSSGVRLSLQILAPGEMLDGWFSSAASILVEFYSNSQADAPEQFFEMRMRAKEVPLGLDI